MNIQISKEQLDEFDKSIKKELRKYATSKEKLAFSEGALWNSKLITNRLKGVKV